MNALLPSVRKRTYSNLFSQTAWLISAVEELW